MNSLSKRIDRIEERLDPDKGPGLHWPNGDGTFTEIPGCLSLNDPKIALRVASLTDVVAPMHGSEDRAAATEEHSRR